MTMARRARTNVGWPRIIVLTVVALVATVVPLPFLDLDRKRS